MKRKLFALLLGVVVVAVVVGALVLFRDRKETVQNVSHEDALATVGVRAAARKPVAAGLGPASGAYDYVGSGREAIDALSTTTRTLPKRAVGVVVDDDACSWYQELVLGEDHLERAVMCSSDGGTQLTLTEFHHKLLTNGRGVHEKLVCDTPLEIVAGSNELSANCREKDAILAKVRGRIVHDTVKVAGTPTDALRLAVTVRYSGDTVGTERIDRWFAADGLLLRVRARADLTNHLVLTSHFVGRYDYTLTAVPPAREQ